MGLLERQSEAHGTSPDHPAALPRRAVKQFETVRQIEMSCELNAGSARRVVDENAVDGGRLRSEKDLGRARDPAARANALIETLVLHR